MTMTWLTKYFTLPVFRLLIIARLIAITNVRLFHREVGEASVIDAIRGLILVRDRRGLLAGTGRRQAERQEQDACEIAEVSRAHMIHSGSILNLPTASH